jgi:hypothetical protein
LQLCEAGKLTFFCSQVQFNPFLALLVEGLLRATVDPVNNLRPRLEPEPILNHKIAPKCGGADAWGFRNKTVPATSDIVAIDDSITYGAGASANYCWPSRLQKYVNRNTYNLGMSAYGPAQYLYLLEHKRSLIVVGLFFGNDFIDAYNVVYKYDYWRFLRAPDFPAENSQDIKTGVDFSQRKTFRFLAELHEFARSHLILHRVLSEAFADAVRRIYTLYFSTSSNPELTILLVDNPKIITAFRVSKDTAVDVRDRRTREGLRISLEAFRKMHMLCKDTRVEFVVALIPTKKVCLPNTLQGIQS